MSDNTQKKYLVQLELRYRDAPDDNDEDGLTQVNVVTTLGVFDDVNDAYKIGNECLEELENRFPLNKNWNKRYRLGANNGPFGYPTHLISNLGYLITPFEFYLSVKTLKYLPIIDEVVKATEALERYTAYSKSLDS